MRFPWSRRFPFSWLGTEDETWDYVDSFPRVRGFRLGNTMSQDD